MPPKKPKQTKNVEAFIYDDASRKNIPTAEYQSVMEKSDEQAVPAHYARRNRDLDPQLVWRGKDEQDWSDLVVHAPPLYIQEKVHPKVLIDDLRRQTASNQPPATDHWQPQLDLFADFNGLPDDNAKTEFYQHDANWTNRMILGDSLQVMASLAEREGLQGKVQCIYLDPPYGIKFNSNFQWSTTSRDVKDGKAEHITREPEQVKAFRDTWRDGIHSYLTYLRDRLTVARDLLHETGSIFVQIGDENVHRVRALMDEVFGEENCINQIAFLKTSSSTSDFLGNVCDHLLWYGKRREALKFREPFYKKEIGSGSFEAYNKARYPDGEIKPLSKLTPEQRLEADVVRFDNITSQSIGRDKGEGSASWFPVSIEGREILPNRKVRWKTNEQGMGRLKKAGRLYASRNSLSYVRRLNDFAAARFHHIWTDTVISGSSLEKNYVVETLPLVVQRCILMTTDPADLVLDPTCGSGTTAYVAEQWGRRWITVDTSRVSLALARTRIMGARYPFYLLADSKEGQQKEAEITRTAPSEKPTHGNIRHGFVYERIPHIMLSNISHNSEIDVIYDQFQEKIGPLLEQLSKVVGEKWIVNSQKTNHSSLSTHHSLAEWEVPREFPEEWPDEAKKMHEQFWKARVARQREIDASIAAKADFEYLYDKPYEDKKTVRVAGPFTVESLSPHRTLAVDADDELIDPLATKHSPLDTDGAAVADFAQMVMENLQTSGVQQAHKEDKLNFSSITPWPGRYICAEGRYQVESEECRVDADGKLATKPLSTDSSTELRAGIFVGPEFGTVARQDLVAAAREAGDADFDVLIACAFNYEAHASEFDRLGRIPILKARMNADLHMADDLKNTGKGNLFVIFGEPDIEVASEEWLVDSRGQRIAPYEIFKLVSGIDSLAEINRLGREDLQDHASLSCRREVWDYLTDAAGLDLDPSEHSGGTGTSDNGGVSSVAWYCAGLPGRTGDVRDVITKIEPAQRKGFGELIGKLRGDKQNAKRTDAFATATIHSPLSTVHYSQVKVLGVDVFHPQTGEVRSDGAEGIACWFIDTDYNEESFFVRHAYFLGQNDPYKSLKTTLKSEINKEAWETLHSDTSRPFDKPLGGRIAVKVINHLGDEVMKVFRV